MPKDIVAEKFKTQILSARKRRKAWLATVDSTEANILNIFHDRARADFSSLKKKLKNG